MYVYPTCIYRYLLDEPVLTAYLKVFYSYTYGTAGWLAIQAAPLILSPTMIITLLSPEVRDSTR